MSLQSTYKRHIALLCLWGTMPQTAMADNEEGSTAYVTATHLILRKKPDIKAAPITQLSQGEPVLIISLHAEWVYVSYKKHKGYVKGEYIRLASQGNGEASYAMPTTAGGALRLHDAGSEVSALQDMLKSAGYDVSTDGVFGSKTEDALLAFQRQYGLAEDGKAGQQTFSKLRAVVGAAPSGAGQTRSPGSALRLMDEGDAVRELQQLLQTAGYGISADGVFGSGTQQAVIAFQQRMGIEADGLAGQQTVTLLRTSPPPGSSASFSAGEVEMLDWWQGGSKAIPVGAQATVIDVRTGLRFTIRRWGGTNHADVEPLTAEDSAAMKRIYGGAWSWNRRAIWVVYGGRTFAASMNGMPHMGYSIKTNQFDGHFCIHMKNSRTHGTNRVDAAHQAAVQEAYSKRGNLE